MNRKLGTLVALLALSSTAVHAEGMQVVANAKAGVTKLSKADLREALTGKMKLWPGSGKLVQVAMGPEGSADSAWTAGFVFAMGEVVMITKMKQEVFKGEMRKPLLCNGDDECLGQVKVNDGGLAVVSTGAKLPAGVVAITIE